MEKIANTIITITATVARWLPGPSGIDDCMVMFSLVVGMSFTYSIAAGGAAYPDKYSKEFLIYQVGGINFTSRGALPSRE